MLGKVKSKVYVITIHDDQRKGIRNHKIQKKNINYIKKHRPKKIFQYNMYVTCFSCVNISTKIPKHE